MISWVMMHHFNKKSHWVESAHAPLNVVISNGIDSLPKHILVKQQQTQVMSKYYLCGTDHNVQCVRKSRDGWMEVLTKPVINSMRTTCQSVKMNSLSFITPIREVVRKIDLCMHL